MSDKVSHVLPTYARVPLEFERGEGTALFTAKGERYLDFVAGVAVNALGHCNPVLIEALEQQARKVWHVSNLYRIPGQERLADRLCEATFADYVFFTNSGAEAIEISLKMARKYFAHRSESRHRFITFEGAFHGRTFGALAAGGNAKYMEGFGPHVPGFDQLPLGDLDAVERAITSETAAILIEPIQGEGGVRVPPQGFLKGLRALCDKHGLLLVLDEIQCGMGRTGKLFAHEWEGVTPDIMAVAKAVGGGFPLGACLATKEASSGMVVATHGSTYGGNPLAMAVGNAVLDIVLEPDFLARVREAGILLKQKLAGLVDDMGDIVEEVRGEGLIAGLKCRVPAGDLVAAARANHLLTVAAGDNVVRLLPPLIVSNTDIDEAIDALRAACASLRADLRSKSA